MSDKPAIQQIQFAAFEPAPKFDIGAVNGVIRFKYEGPSSIVIGPDLARQLAKHLMIEAKGAEEQKRAKR